MMSAGTGEPFEQTAEHEDVRAAMRRLLAATGASFEQRANLERALKTRIVIEQAKGILAERLRMTVDEAFELLRGSARSSRRRIHELAEEVIRDQETPPEILAYREEPPRRRS
jgi:AmiR/NasT family two-component response regulator